MKIAAHWKSATGLLLGLVLLLGLLPTFSAQAQTTSVLALVRGRGATLYDQPGGKAMETLDPGDRLDATGRTEDASWITGTTGDGQMGWLRTDDVIIYDLLTLPVVDGMASPVMQPTSAPAEEGAALLPTPSPTPTQPPTPTQLPSPTPLPSPSPSPTPVPSPTPLVVPNGGTTIVAIARGGGADLLSAPQSQVLESVDAGAPLTIAGRSADNGWLLATSADGVVGWVARGQVVVFGVENVPVLALPTVDAAPAMQPDNSMANSSMAMSGGSDDLALAATVSTGTARLNVRSGPATTYAIVAKAQDGAPLSLLARNADGSWVQVVVDGGTTGWVSARFIATDGSMDSLPVSTAISDALPLALAAPAPSAQPAQSQPAQSPQASISRPFGMGQASTQRSTQTGLTGKLALAAADGSIILFDMASGSLRRLTSGFDPAISPDGSRVAFLRGGEGLLVIDVDGSHERQLYSGGEEIRSPAWSPDGQFVVFSRVTGGESCRNVGFGICLPDVPQFADYELVWKVKRTLSRVDLNGENFQDIPTLDTAISPSWGTTGIVYQSKSGLQITQDGPNVDKDGKPINRDLTREYLHRDPDWRPDGGRVVLMDATANHQEIYAINPDGNGLVALTRPKSALLETLPHNVAPAWSPDGQWIAFLSNRDGDWAVYVMDGDGANQQRVDVGVKMEYRFQNEQILNWGR